MRGPRMSQPAGGDDYTYTPNHLRISYDRDMLLWEYHEGDTPRPWQLDAIDTRQPERPYTEAVYNFRTFAEAVAALPQFWSLYVAQELGPDIRTYPDLEVTP